MGPGDLAQVLRPLVAHSHPNLIVGLNPGDGTHPGLPQSQWFGDDYQRFGFRVPNLVISPWAKGDHVSHVVRDHGSILRTIENHPDMVVAGVGLGSASWWLILAAITAALRARVTPTVARTIGIVSGLAIAGLGAVAVVASFGQ